MIFVNPGICPNGLMRNDKTLLQTAGPRTDNNNNNNNNNNTVILV
jgi:hypothetical protein